MVARHWTLAALSLIFMVAAPAAEFNPARQPGARADSDVASQRVIVRLRDAVLSTAAKPTAALPSSTASSTTSAAPLAALATRTRLTFKGSREIALGLQVMEFTPATSGESLAVSLARLRADPAVQYAEVDARRYAHAIPSDPLFVGQWYLQNAANTPSAVNAQAAWDIVNGSPGVVIADLDTGIRYDHPDLQRSVQGGRLLPGYDFVTNVSIANDGDGRDSDAADPGDWVTAADVATPTFSGCTAEGSSWHGTRTAGIMAAQANNGVGVTGAIWRGFILPERVLGKCGGFDSDIMAAMLWAAGIHVNGVPDNPTPARVENLSLGSTASACPASYVDVISQLAARGVLVVASAGNEGGPVDVPARCAGVVAVAGLRHVGTKVGYSNLGSQVTLSAPAGNCVNVGGGPCLFSIDTTTNTGTTVPANDSYTDQINSNVGTSFSSPIVAGIAGLMLAANGNLGAAQLLARLQEGASKPFPVPVPVQGVAAVPQCLDPASAAAGQNFECSCTISTCGAGMANALGAVNAALRPIAAVRLPTSVSAGQNVVLQGDGSAAACSHSVSSYAWSVLPGAANPPTIQGAQTASATVVAPASGSFTLRLTVTDEGGRQDSADVVVSSSAVASTAPATAAAFAGARPCLAAVQAAIPDVSVSPANASVAAAGVTQVFTATVTNTTNTSVNWQVNGIAGGDATVGTISTTGVYTSPAAAPTPATVTVTAVLASDTTRSASAQVIITAAVVVTPPAPSSGGGGGVLDGWLLCLLAALALLRRRSRSNAARGALRP